MDDAALTLLQLSYRTNLPSKWLKAEAAARRIPCLKIGRHLRFNLRAVMDAIGKRAAKSKMPKLPVKEVSVASA